VAIEDDKVLTLEVVDNVAIVDAVFPVYVLIDDVYELNVVSSNLPVPIGLPFKYIEPVILTDPVNVASVLTSNPLFGDIEALTLPEMILLRFNPVTPLAGMLYKLDPSPLNDPLNEPVLYDEVNELKLLVKVYFGA
jgi:hypothetical protein